MRPALRALAWVLVALGFLAVGADAYWSWKAHSWAFGPIAFYLDLIDPHWTAAIAEGAAEWSPRAARVAARALAWPVWGPAFVIGFGLSFLTQPPHWRADVRPR